MRILTLGVLLCGGLLIADAAQAAGRTPRRAKAPVAKVLAAPAPTARVAYVPAPRRTKPPVLAARPELSDGEWGEPASNDQLTSNDLAGATIVFADAEERLEAARQGESVKGLRERNLQNTPPLADTNIAQPLRDSAPTKLEIPSGLDLSTLGLRITEAR
jgi:hypothetical protein